MDLNLKNKKVFISGGSKGIGKAIVKAFLDEGAYVAFIARNIEQIHRTKTELLEKFKSDRILAYSVDASDEKEFDLVLEKISYEWGELDILISNIGDGRSVNDAISSKEQFQKVWDVNFSTAENLVRSGLKFIKKENSSVLFISSITGIEALGAPTDYSVAKAAIIALSKNLARKLAPNIRVNCIAPGNIFFEGGSWDEKIKNNSERVNNIIQTTVPMKRFGTPEEIADAVLFLSSTRASFITGSCLIVDGGQTLSLH